MSYVDFYDRKRNKKYRKTFKLLFIILTVFIFSLFMEKKYDLLYKTVYLENKYLHKETFKIILNLKKLDKKLPVNIYSLNINGLVEFAKTPDYDMEVLIPNDFIILKRNKIDTTSYKGNIYKKLSSNIKKRKYRNLIINNEILIYSDKRDISDIKIIASIRYGNESIFRMKDYSLSVKGGVVFLSKT